MTAPVHRTSVERVEALEAENAELRRVVEFYADERNWLNDREFRGLPGFHANAVAARYLRGEPRA